MTTSTERAKTPVTDATSSPAPAATRPPTRSDFADEPATVFERVLVAVFVTVPLLALIAAIPLAWGWGLVGWHDIVIALVFYCLTGLGITVGFHRYFTHGSFKAKSGLRVALAVCGTMAIQGPVFNWVADHRRHHKYSDKEGDPHSPVALWQRHQGAGQGPGLRPHALAVRREQDLAGEVHPRPAGRPQAPDRRKLFPWLVLISMLAPALIGGLWSMSWHGALTAFFWASLVRVALLHHVTWSINSICHTFGTEEFEVRDKSRNVCLAGHRLVRRVLAQPAPRRPDLRPARRAQGPARLERPGDLGAGEAGLGLRRALAGRRAAGGQACRQRDPEARLDDTVTGWTR